MTGGHAHNRRQLAPRARRKEPGRTSIDVLDKRLITELARDARRSFRDLALTLGVSTSTVATRIRALEEEGVVKGYAVLTDHQKLGYELTVVTEIVVAEGRLLSMEREIAKLSGVCAVYDVTGDTDGIIIAKFRDRESLSAFTKSLLGLPFVERTNTHIVLTTVREDFRLPPVEPRGG